MTVTLTARGQNQRGIEIANMRKGISILVLSLFSALVTDCGGGLRLTGYGREMRPVISRIEEGDWNSAKSTFRNHFSGILSDEDDDDYVLALIEGATLDFYNGNLDSAELAFLKADLIIDYLRQIEFTEGVERFITGDLALRYRGSDYEQVFVNYYLMKIYICKEEYEEAIVECRAVNQKLQLMNNEYERELQNRYANDAFLQYITGVLYEQAGDYDDALVSYRNSLSTYTYQYSLEYEHEVPPIIIEDILRLTEHLDLEGLADEYRREFPNVDLSSQHTGSTELVLVIEDGLIPPRYEKVVEVSEIEFRVPYMPAMDELDRQPDPRIGLCINGDSCELHYMQSMEAIASKNIEDQNHRHIIRSLSSENFRNLAQQSIRAVGEGFGLLGQITSTVIGATAFSRPYADLRTWLTLPKNFYLARMQVPPGVYQPKIILNDSIFINCESVTVYDKPPISIVFIRVIE